VGVGIEAGSNFLFGADAGGSYSRLFGWGVGLVTSIGYLLDPHWSVNFTAVFKITFGGTFTIDYGPRIGVRF
jgi:hypothetical protein